MAKMVSIVLFALFLLVCTVPENGRAGPPSSAGSRPDSGPKPREEAPPVLPAIFLPDPSGTRVDVSALRGHPLLVMNLMATWCVPCLRELPSLLRLSRNSKGRISVVEIVEGPGSLESLEEILKKNRAEVRVLLDPSGRIPPALRASGLPTSYLVDGDGQIVSWVSGRVHWTNPKVDRYLETFIPPKAGP